jgi:dTMP kinase
MLKNIFSIFYFSLNIFKQGSYYSFMFIVFDGIDGCGKSAQMDLLANYLFYVSKYNHLMLTREPYKAREIREILKKEEPAEEKAEKLTELFLKDRKEHVEEIILPNLKNNFIVICSRYKYSTIAYQSAQGQDIQKLAKMHEGLPVPDFVFIIDTPSKTAEERMNTDSAAREKHKFEKDTEFLEKVRQNYLKMPEVFPDENIIILDGNKSIEEIFKDIKKHFVQNQ